MRFNWRRLPCALGKCTRCRLHSTYEGIGGKCIDCGRIHGWMTREELQALAPTSAEGETK